DNPINTSCISDTLISKPLELADWPELADHLRDYLSSYDHKMVCADSELATLDCQLAMTSLAREYFNLAIKQTASGHPSRVWRQADTGELYGAMLVLDPAQDIDSIPQIMQSSINRRNQCSKTIMRTDASERLRYLRIHVNPNKDTPEEMKKAMLDQFLEETMQWQSCSEYRAGGEHLIAIFPNIRAEVSVTFENEKLLSANHNHIQF
ncbi:hypothetical protein P879_05485, partial [Paragonimus westermani]